MLSLLRLEHKQKKNRIRTFLFLSYSFEIETINTFILSRGPVENHTRFQTKIGKVNTPFQTKKDQKHYPMRRHIIIWLLQGSTPPDKIHLFSLVCRWLAWISSPLAPLGRPDLRFCLFTVFSAWLAFFRSRKTVLLPRFSQTCEFWSSKANWRLLFSLPSIILSDLLGNKTLL